MKNRGQRFKVELTAKELNYLDVGLRDTLFRLENPPELAKMGNVPSLIWFTRRLRGKLNRIHYPPRGVPKSTPEVRALIRRMREAQRQEVEP